MIGLNPNGRNIFLINTPFQFLLACLMDSTFHLQSELIVMTDYSPSISQIKQIAKVLNDNKHQEYQIKFKKLKSSDYNNRIKLLAHELIKYFSILNFRARLNSNDNIFIGLSTFPLYRSIISKSRKYNLIFFDDGMATIRFLRQREEGQRKIEFPHASLVYFYTKFYPRSIKIDNMTYFTIYPGLKGGKDDKIVNFKAQLPHHLFKKKKHVNELWFIGGPLVENMLVSSSKYLFILNNLSKTCAEMGLKFVYFAHRIEKWIHEQIEIEIRQPNLPWELFFAQSETMPIAIVSIMSSVIVNLFVLDEAVCPLIYLEMKETGKKHDIINEIQNYAKEVLKLPVINIRKLGSMLSSLNNLKSIL